MQITAKYQLKELIEAVVARGGTFRPGEKEAMDAWMAPLDGIRLPEGWFVERLLLDMVRFSHYQNGQRVAARDMRIKHAADFAAKLLKEAM